MKGYRFDPSWLDRPAKQLERRGYAVAAGMLRDYLGGDVLAEVRLQVRRDPGLRAMFSATAAELAAGVEHLRREQVTRQLSEGVEE